MGSFGRRVKLQSSTIQCTALRDGIRVKLRSTAVQYSDFKVGTCMWSNEHRARTEVDKRPGLKSDRLVHLPNASAPIGFPGIRRALNSDQPHTPYSESTYTCAVRSTVVFPTSNFRRAGSCM